MGNGNIVFAVCIVLGVIVSNLTNQQLARKLVFHDGQTPLFIVAYDTAFLVVLWPTVFIISYLHRRYTSNELEESNEDGIFSIERSALESKFSFSVKLIVLAGLYVATNFFIVVALGYIPNTKAATVLALDPLLCFTFGFLFLNSKCSKENVQQNMVQLMSAILSIVGVFLCFFDEIVDSTTSSTVNATFERNSTSMETNETDNTVIGLGFAFLATVGAAGYKTFCAKYVKSPTVREVSLMLSLIGFLDLVIVLPIAVVQMGLENLKTAPIDVLTLMAFASLIFNLLVNYGSVIIYPLFIAVAFSMCLPGNLIIDLFVHGSQFTAIQFCGVALAFSAILVLLIHSFFEGKKSKSENETTEPNEVNNEYDSVEVKTNLLED